METAPKLTASGLEGDYRLLADFNNIVLAGHPIQYGSMFVMDYRPMVKDITVPLLYLIPDAGLYPQAAPDFLKENSSADVEIIHFPGATHMLPIETPDKVAADIKAFIEK